MILRWLPLVVSVGVFMPSLLHAQQHSFMTRRTYVVDVLPNNDKMYEDIEILRRILDRKLQDHYPSHTYQSFGIAGMGGMAGMQGGMGIGGMRGGMGGMTDMHGGMGGIGGMQGGLGMAGGTIPVVVPMRSLEGVYLKGQGIVYTATLASLQPPAKAEADSTVKELFESIVQQDSEWESIRRQVRNEKEKPKKPEASKPPSLSDALLKVLAENGHNFSQLGENESLTLVLTQHGSSRSSSAAKSGKGSAKKESISAAHDLISGLHVEVRDTELLGELHLKQGKHDEAIGAFQYVLKRTSDPKREAELHRKLAQCYLMQGQDEKARAELNQAIDLMKKATEAKAKPSSAAKPAAALPVKLIISAPKKLLDQVKAGKISFEEFRRQAHVETLRFDDRR